MNIDEIRSMTDREAQSEAIKANLAAFEEASNKNRIEQIFKAANGDLEEARYRYSMTAADLDYWKSLKKEREKERKLRQRNNAEIVEGFLNGGGYE